MFYSFHLLFLLFPLLHIMILSSVFKFLFFFLSFIITLRVLLLDCLFVFRMGG